MFYVFPVYNKTTQYQPESIFCPIRSRGHGLRLSEKLYIDGLVNLV